ncbi:MAG: hypothetical protein WD403_06330, partial [Pirellulales bacterium]
FLQLEMADDGFDLLHGGSTFAKNSTRNVLGPCPPAQPEVWLSNERATEPLRPLRKAMPGAT